MRLVKLLLMWMYLLFLIRKFVMLILCWLRCVISFCWLLLSEVWWKKNVMSWVLKKINILMLCEFCLRRGRMILYVVLWSVLFNLNNSLMWSVRLWMIIYFLRKKCVFLWLVLSLRLKVLSNRLRWWKLMKLLFGCR